MWSIFQVVPDYLQDVSMSHGLRKSERPLQLSAKEFCHVAE